MRRAMTPCAPLTCAVYSTADEQSLHVQLADEAICIGPAAPGQSYLNIPQIIAAAEVADVEAKLERLKALIETDALIEKTKLP